jgi:hypothetical protein
MTAAGAKRWYVWTLRRVHKLAIAITMTEFCRMQRIHSSAVPAPWGNLGVNGGGCDDCGRALDCGVRS